MNRKGGTKNKKEKRGGETVSKDTELEREEKKLLQRLAGENSQMRTCPE